MIGIKDFLNYVSLSELTVSPGERFAAYAVKQAVLAGNRYTRELWVCDLETRQNRRLLADGEITGNYTWADSESLYYALAGSGCVDICEMNVLTGDCRPAVTLPEGAAQAVYAGGLWYYTRLELPAAAVYPEEIAFLAEHEAGFETADEIPLWDNGRGFTSGKRNALYCLAPGEAPVRLTGPDTSVDTLRTEGGRVLFTARTFRGRNTEPGIYEAAAGGVTMLVPEGIYRIFDFRGDPDGDRVWFIAQDKRIHTMTSDPGFYTAVGGRVEKLPVSDRSAADSVSIDVQYGSNPGFACEDGWLYYTATRDWSSCTERVRLDGTDTQVLTPAGGAVSGFVKLKGGALLYVGLRGMQLQELYLCENGSLTALTRHNSERLDPAQVIEPTRFSFEQFGFPVNYVVLPPADFDPARKYPAVLYIHGGAKILYSTVFFHEMQYLASCGYYVIYGNPHGSDGQGSEFADLLGHYGEKDFADLMKAVDTALELYPNIDPQRLGVAGGSYGGIMTNWCVTHTDRFRCGVAQRSICSMVSTFGTADNGFGFVREQMDGDLWNGAEKLWRQSPLKYADHCHTPLLLIHSDEDHRCDYTEAVQMFTALRYLGVESRMVLIRGEDHGLSRNGRPVQRIRRLYEIRRWLDTYLMPENT